MQHGSSITIMKKKMITSLQFTKKKKMITSLQFTILVKHKYKYIHLLKFLDYDQNSCLNYGFGSAVDLTPLGT